MELWLLSNVQFSITELLPVDLRADQEYTPTLTAPLRPVLFVNTSLVNLTLSASITIAAPEEASFSVNTQLSIVALASLMLIAPAELALPFLNVIPETFTSAAVLMFKILFHFSASITTLPSPAISKPEVMFKLFSL